MRHWYRGAPSRPRVLFLKVRGGVAVAWEVRKRRPQRPLQLATNRRPDEVAPSECSLRYSLLKGQGAPAEMRAVCTHRYSPSSRPMRVFPAAA
eukprot:scaffold7086_cov120-Isochrysis_galbana.AAC.5